jgi:hypothetical protein
MSAMSDSVIVISFDLTMSKNPFLPLERSRCDYPLLRKYYFRSRGRHIENLVSAVSDNVLVISGELAMSENPILAFGTKSLRLPVAEKILLPVSRPPFCVFGVGHRRMLSATSRLSCLTPKTWVSPFKPRCYL